MKSAPASKATLHDLCRVTGLSLATVSRALSGAETVTPATRERVLSAARDLNYVRDRAAVRLKTGKTQVLAFLLDRFDANQPGFQDMLLGLSDSVAGTDYHLIMLPEARDADPLATVRYVVERGMADGLVISHTQPHDVRVTYLQDQGFPFITHGRTSLARAHAFVDFANEQYAAMAVQALTVRGRRRLAMLLPEEGSLYRTHLAEGFLTACQQVGVEGECVRAVSLDQNADQIYQWAHAQAHRFDGLVVSREAPMLPLVSALTDRGRVLGRDVDLVIKYSSTLPHFIRQPFMACFEDLHLTGRTMGQSLLAHFSRPGLASAQVLFPPPKLEFFHHGPQGQDSLIAGQPS